MRQGGAVAPSVRRGGSFQGGQLTDSRPKRTLEPDPRRQGRPPVKGDPKIIAHLNAVLKNELTSINQYFLHSRMLKDWGLHRLAEKDYEESIDEMTHAERVTERIGIDWPVCSSASASCSARTGIEASKWSSKIQK